MRQTDLEAIGRVWVDENVEALNDVADSGNAIGVRAAARDDARATQLLCQRRAREIEAACAIHLIPQRANDTRVMAGEVEHETFEIRCLGYIHRRARRCPRLRCVAHAITP